MIIMLPLSIICLVDNGVYRVSDTYRYNFNDTEVISQEGLNVDVYDMAHAFSGYLMGKQDKFHLTEKTGDNKIELFSENAANTMRNLKFLLDIMLIAGIACLLLTVAAFVFLIIKGMKEKMRRWFNKAPIVFLVLLIFNFMAQLFIPLRNAMFGWMYHYDFDANELFVVIMKGSIIRQFSIFEGIASAVILAICWYIARMLTKPRRIFFGK